MAFTGKLTAEQIGEVQRSQAEWMAQALRTDRCDRPAAERAVAAAYVAAGLTPPATVVWMDSPIGGVVAKAALRTIAKDRDQLRVQLGVQLGDQLQAQLRDQLRVQLRDQLQVQLRDQLRDQLGSQLRGQLGDQLGDRLGVQLQGQLWDQLQGQLGSQLRDQLRDQLGVQLRGQLWAQLEGQLWAQLEGQLWDQLEGRMDPWFESYWLAFYGSALPIAGLPRSERLDTVSAAVQACGWWWPMQGAVVITDRPTRIERDAQGRLHSQDGPALAWADGYELWSWHGVTVPKEVIVPGWSPEQIFAERNAEIRRCAIERFGWDRFAADAEMKEIDSAPDPGNPGQLLRLFELPERLTDLFEEPAHILICANASLDRDGTRRVFGLPVPSAFRDPISAAASTFDVSRAEYLSLARAT
jgi:hypothetical protein